MLGFFNKKNRFVAAMRLYNSVAFVYAAYDYYTNPDASWDEQGLEMALNALNIFSLRENGDVLTGVTSAALNCAGLGAIFRGYISGWSSVNSAINVVGGAGHVLSAFASADNTIEDKDRSNMQPR